MKIHFLSLKTVPSIRVLQACLRNGLAVEKTHKILYLAHL